MGGLWDNAGGGAADAQPPGSTASQGPAALPFCPEPHLTWPLLSPDHLHGFLIVSAPSTNVHRALELPCPSLIETPRFEHPATNEHLPSAL